LTRYIAIIDAISERVGGFASWLTLLMVAVGTTNALARYAGKLIGLNLSSNASIELQWQLFSMVFLLGAAATLRRDQHVRVDVLYGRLSKRNQAWLDLVGGVFFLVPFCIFGLVMCWPAVRNSWAVLEVSPDPGGLVRYPIKAMMLACFGLLLLQGSAEIARRVHFLRGGER
jgi:TRAP-type mannitol/chloroaromatic compound transport system permease small subunit